MQHWIPAPAESLADLLAFTPVPRRKRAGGWTAERQRGFIAALAETGSVKAAARAVNMAPEGAYALRRHPEGASLAAAWLRAQASGMQRLTDIAIERATEGVRREAERRIAAAQAMWEAAATEEGWAGWKESGSEQRRDPVRLA